MPPALTPNGSRLAAEWIAEFGQAAYQALPRHRHLEWAGARYILPPSKGEADDHRCD